MPPAEHPTPSDLIAGVRAARRAADAAEVEVLRLALAWADAHPDLDPDSAGELDDEADREWRGVPRVRWDAAAPFAAANAMSTPAGRALLRDALVMRHRMPLTHAEVVAGRAPVWRARRVAQAVLGVDDDVAAYVDRQVAGRLASVGPTTLDRIVDEAMLRLHAEEREWEQLEALDAQHATLHERTINHTGIAEMTLRARLPDLQDFDRALSDVAEALARDGVEESLDVRRAMAIGILAEPAAALALLAGDPAWADRCVRRRVHLVVHLSDLALLGLDPVAGLDTHRTGTPVLDQAVRDWCGRPGTRISVRPVLDLSDTLVTEHYRPTATQLEWVGLRDQTCAFPWCQRRAERCDADHVVAWLPGERTSTDNLAPLCRHHHRLKTHAGWRYVVIEPGVYLWSDPHGQRFVRTRDGTRDVGGADPRGAQPVTSSTTSAIESTTRVGR